MPPALRLSDVLEVGSAAAGWGCGWPNADVAAPVAIPDDRDPKPFTGDEEFALNDRRSAPEVEVEPEPGAN